MNRLTLLDVKVLLAFLTRARRADLVHAVGEGTAAAMEGTLAAIEKLPPALLGLPLSEALRETDARHDAWGSSIHGYCTAIIEAPSSEAVSSEARAAARAVRELIVPGLRELGSSYVTEAARATDRRGKLEQIATAMEKLPVPGGTIRVWVEAFLWEGMSLGNLLVQRADESGDRSTVMHLRTEGLSKIARARSLAAGTDLEHRLFGYLDTILAMRTGGSSEPAPPPPAPPTT